MIREVIIRRNKSISTLEELLALAVLLDYSFVVFYCSFVVLYCSFVVINKNPRGTRRWKQKGRHNDGKFSLVHDYIWIIVPYKRNPPMQFSLAVLPHNYCIELATATITARLVPQDTTMENIFVENSFSSLFR